MTTKLMPGNNLESLRLLPDNSVDSIVTDPPYGLSFMGKKWDYDVPTVELWAECLRVLKPGGHLLAFAGTRTQHRMAVRIEDAGFEIRDMIAWVYGSGFPKSLDVSKAIDKAAGAEREVVGENPYANRRPNAIPGEVMQTRLGVNHSITAPATPYAFKWQGWGTALKPALEPITVARKPLIGTVAANVLEFGTGALNVDGCRVEGEPWKAHKATGLGSVKFFTEGHAPEIEKQPHAAGRWPANLIHDGETAADMLGEAARFFYCAKASKKDRDEGLDEFEKSKTAGSGALRDGGRETDPRANIHPTVKPTDLMRYLCRLVTQPGGVVLDPFMGSGSTGKAAHLEGFSFIGMELSPEYFAIAEARISNAA